MAVTSQNISKMNAGIIIIGDEILIGQVVDINSSWISREMNKIGFRTETVITVGDDGKSISDAIDRCLEVADVVFMTGGLGPTKDDITKKVICEKFGTELVLNEVVLANVSASGSHSMDISAYPEGLYIVRVSTSAFVANKKIMLTK